LHSGEYRPSPGLELGGGPGERIHRLLHFAEIPDAAAREALSAAGVELLEYLPERTYLASLPGGMAPDHPALAGLVFAGPLRLEDKVSARVFSSAEHRLQEDGRLEVALRPQRDLTPGQLVAALSAAGFEARLDGRGQLLLRLSPEDLPRVAALDEVSLIDLPLPRLVLLNDGARAAAEVEALHGSAYGLDGSGVRVGIWDGTGVDTGHPDLSGRVTVAPGEYAPTDCAAEVGCRHATHVAGTVAGDGARSQAEGGAPEQWRGMAPAAQVYSYEFIGGSDLWAEVVDAIDLYDIDQTQNSWGFCIDDHDPSCAPCSTYGDYEGLTEVEDRLVRGEGGKPLIVVFSAGNSRNDVAACGLNGSPYVNYGTLTPPGTAKNTLTVGAVNGNDRSMTTFSSWGPTDDGRIKPDLVAPGCENPRSDSSPSGSIWSLGGGGEGYAGWCGTSMSAPVVSGGVALLVEEVRGRTGQAPRPRTVRAVLAHTAEDLSTALGSDVGPDYATGWGLVRFQSALDRLRGGGLHTASVGQGGQWSHSLVVEAGAPELKVTLAWDDPAASPLASPTLVNDLDLLVTSPSQARAYPWSLDPQDPGQAATRDAEDHRNNIEQVVVDDPEAGTWSVVVRGTTVPDGVQAFTLIADPDPDAEPFGPELPEEGELFYPDDEPALFSWHAAEQVKFKLKWARSASFGTPFKTSGKRWLTEDSFTPSTSLWLSVLRLGKSTGTVYWRVKGKDTSGDKTLSETRSFRVASAAPAEVTAPAEAQVFASDAPPPTLTWEANHNKKYRVVFATRADLGGRLTVASDDKYTLTGTSWTIPARKWEKIVTKLAPKSPDGTVYYVLFSKDALKRKTQAPVRTLRVSDGP
jgi:subtilisin family serine protease